MDDIFGKIFLPFVDKKDGYTISMGQLFIASDSAAMDVPIDFWLCVSGLYFCTNEKQNIGSAATFELLASPNLYRSRLNVPHMKALVTKI